MFARFLLSIAQEDAIIQHVDCAVGFHLGPVGTRVIGTDDPAPPAVVERRDDHVGCETKSVRRNGTRYWSMSATAPYEKSPIWDSLFSQQLSRNALDAIRSRCGLCRAFRCGNHNPRSDLSQEPLFEA
jgi:hypothetical protein